MTYDDWLASLPPDERAALPHQPAGLGFYRAWQAGARAMREALVERGFVSVDYAVIASKETQDVIGEEPK